MRRTHHSVYAAFALPLLCACADPAFGELAPQSETATGLVLLVHGSGDSPSDWAEPLAQHIEAHISDLELWDIATYDWTEDAAKRLSAANIGLKHGEAIGDLLTYERAYTEVQVIAHSVGAHVAHGIALNWHEGTLQQTLLDPFGGRGLVRWGYGYNHFGEDASYAETYFNADDGVPSTERAPRQTHGFDVTALRTTDYEDDAHWWPIDWYHDSLGTGVGLDLSLAFGGQPGWEDYPSDQETILAP